MKILFIHKVELAYPFSLTDSHTGQSLTTEDDPITVAGKRYACWIRQKVGVFLIVCPIINILNDAWKATL